MAFSPTQIAYAVFILTLFLVYGVLVRRTIIEGRAILWVGGFIGLAAVVASLIDLWPAYRMGRVPMSLLIINAGMMALCAGFCVALSYRSQRTVDLATYALGDTKIIVLLCPPGRVPDAGALLVPTVTSLRPMDGLAALIGVAAGGAVSRELRRLGPVGIGKAVTTGPGSLAVGRIIHVAVADPFKPVDAVTLRKGMETAAQQARKAKAESIAVPLGDVRGLTPEAATSALIGGVLRYHKAFAEVVFVVIDGQRTADRILPHVAAAVAAAA